MTKRFVLAALLAFALPGRAQQVAFSPLSPGLISIGEAMSQPWGKLFWIERTNGKYRMGDKASRFYDNLNFEDLTFDISNNKAWRTSACKAQ